jgi:hypothetical protein
MSLDGRNIALNYRESNGEIASIWHLNSNGFTSIVFPPTVAGAISVSNGSQQQAWINRGSFLPARRWNAGSILELGLTPGYQSFLEGPIGSSGQTLVGSGIAINGSFSDILVWREGTGWQTLPTSAGFARPDGISANEQFIVGNTTNIDPNIGPLTPRRATRWNPDGSSIIAPVIPQSARTHATSITDDGRLAVVYGFIGTSFSNRNYFLWDITTNQLNPFTPSLTPDQGTLMSLGALTPQGREITGMVMRNTIAEPVVFSGPGFTQTLFITDLLRDQGFSLTGWSNLQITTISNDGLKILGSGRFEYAPGQFRNSAWVATIPTPSAAALLGIAALRIRRRR